LIADTCLFIDLQRRVQGALDFVRVNQLSLVTTWITIGELEIGRMHQKTQGLVQEAIVQYPILGIDMAVAQEYGRLRPLIQRQGNMIGSNDLWIAAIAIANDMPVVTRNGSDFGRVPGLKVIEY